MPAIVSVVYYFFRRTLREVVDDAPRHRAESHSIGVWVGRPLVGLVVAYFAFRAAGYAALALAFVAALVVGGQGGPENFLQFVTVGVIVLLVVVFLGNRRESAARR